MFIAGTLSCSRVMADGGGWVRACGGRHRQVRQSIRPVTNVTNYDASRQISTNQETNKAGPNLFFLSCTRLRAPTTLWGESTDNIFSAVKDYSPNSACNFAQGQASKVSEPNGGCIRPTQPDDLSEPDINRSTMASKGQDRTRIFQVVMADTSATILRVSRVISFQPFISASGRRNEAPYPDAFKAASAQGMKWHGGHPAAVFSIDGSSRTYQFGSGHATHTHTAP
ncbi:hypothetical protein DFH06DRAFT_1135748 [Mycena polygramma]|nr:hypothetical protein DFH06DRAFT_1135748 [Mycena polygramma]